MDWMILLAVVGVLLFGSVLFGAPYVPSHRRDVRRLFTKGYPLAKNDVVLDFGSGDGTVLLEVARAGGRGVGIEIHPLLVGVGRWVTRRVRRQVAIRWGNAWRRPFPDEVTVIYAFSVHRDIPRLLRKVTREAARLGRPLTLISYGNPTSLQKPEATFEAYYIYRIKG